MRPSTKNSLRATALLWLLLAAPAGAAPTVTEFDLPTAAAEPGDIVLGPDGKLWFTEKSANKIGRVTPGNPPLIEEFDVPTNFVEPFNITVGPDNKIWFSGKFNNAGGVGRMNPANPADTQGHGGYGVVTPAGIAAGPDGAVWLGDQGGQVVRVDPATMDELAVSDIQINGGSFNVRNISPGPPGDPNVWVTDFGGRIAKVAPTPPNGAETTFDVPGDGAWDIVVGPDGNLWYTAPEGNNSKIGRITPAGDFGTQFDVTDAGDQLGITAGPDGAFWFAQAVGNSIGRITTSGEFTEVQGLTAAARPEYIATGPDNTLWFTERDGNRIGRITGVIDQPQQPPPPTPDTTRPNVTRFRITRRVFRIGGLGTVIKWTQSEDATVTIRFQRRVRGRFRRVRRKMRFQSTAGDHRLRFRGRIDLKHPLKPGRYRMTLTAKDAAGNVSQPDRARFRLKPRLHRRR
jgi:virginiamycin B lyase